MKLIDEKLSWYVVRTKIKCEDKAEAALRSAGYAVYLPKMRKEIIHHRTKASLIKEYVLFNRYLFCGMTTGDFYTARNCDGVECFLGVNGTPLRVLGKDVSVFQTAEIEMEFDDTKVARKYRGETLDRAFPKNAEIRIKEGHVFGGFYGQVIKSKGKAKVRAMIRMFGGLVPVDFEAREIERV